jgi:hypothetical protein
MRGNSGTPTPKYKALSIFSLSPTSLLPSYV